MRQLKMLLPDSRKMDMTEGKISGLIMKFAIPLFIGSVFQQVYNMADSIVVGQFIGKNALAAVGGCASSYNLILALISGFSTAASVIIAQAYGSGDVKRVRKSFYTSVIVIMVTGVLMTVVGILAARPLLEILGTPADVMDEAVIYLTTICAGILATCLYNAIASCLRAIGNSFIPLLALIMASLINVGLDLFFVLSLGLGVFGTALATVISELMSGIFCLIYALKKTEVFAFSDFQGVRDIIIIKEVFRIGIPAALSSSIVMVSAMFMQRAVNQFGSDVAAAYTAGSRTEQIFMCLSFAIGQAIGTFSGQNIGAEKYDRVKEGMKNGYLINLIYTLVMGCVMFFGAPYVLSVFTTSQKVVEIGVPMVRITAVFAPVLGFVFIFQNFLRSASDISPTIWMSACEISARSILSFVFAAIGGCFGVWWATPVGWSGSMLIGLIRYRSGAWKEKSRKSRDRLMNKKGEVV